MHFEILIEDRSGKKALDILMPKILGDQHSFRVIDYRGVGRIPKNLRSSAEADKRILLDQLPRLLRGYGRTFAGYRTNYSAAVIVVCDLDDKCLKAFRRELFAVLDACNPKPETRFCIAIEEGEAWLLGDIPAVKAAYPKAKEDVLNSYRNDAICGTWERLGRRRICQPRGGAQKDGAAGGGQGEICLGGEYRAPHGCRRQRIAEFSIFS